MSANTQNMESAYQTDLLHRRNSQEARRERLGVIGQQRNDVEEAISLDREATRLEEQTARHDDPTTGFREQVTAAMRGRRTLWTKVIAYLFVGIIDFWLATPDVAESLANKAMPMVLQGALEGMSEGVSVTPVWLRLCVGLTLTLGFLGATMGLTKLSDTADQSETLRALQPGDDLGYQIIRRTIWVKHAIKAGYMLILLGLFFQLFSYDLERAKVMEEVRSLQQEEFEWTDLGVSLTGSELSTNEATPATPIASNSGADTSSTFALAKPALVVYCLLWICHLVLICLPGVPRDVDLSLAGFNRATIGQKADRLRGREGQLLRDILLRINESEDHLRDALIREAQPVAARVNEAARRAAMEVPANPAVDSASAASGQNYQPGTMREGSANSPDFAANGFGQNDSTSSYQSNDDEDPYSTIFGRPA
jgi:hypothetical protein